jgi:hypothetical protein
MSRILMRAALAMVPAALLAIGSVAHAHTATTIMSGLNSPRGLAVAPDGSVYVAEAGMGGAYEYVSSSGTYRFGATGSVSRYARGVQSRVVTGLPSIVTPHGLNGPHDVAMQGVGHGYVTIGLGSAPQTRMQFPAPAHALGTVVRFAPHGGWNIVADLARFEATHNPDMGLVDSNPYGIAVAGNHLFATDAGGNTLLGVRPNGSIGLLGVFGTQMSTLPFPPFSPVPMEAVPTAVAIGPDGALYVSELTGFPFEAGRARIHRVVPGAAPTVYAAGFTTIIDLEFDASGAMWVLQYPVPGLGPQFGSLIRVEGGVRTTVLDGLVDVTSFALGKRGEIYLSSGAFSIGTGTVVRIDP